MSLEVEHSSLQPWRGGLVLLGLRLVRWWDCHPPVRPLVRTNLTFLAVALGTPLTSHILVEVLGLQQMGNGVILATLEAIDESHTRLHKEMLLEEQIRRSGFADSASATSSQSSRLEGVQ